MYNNNNNNINLKSNIHSITRYKFSLPQFDCTTIRSIKISGNGQHIVMKYQMQKHPGYKQQFNNRNTL